MKLFFATFSFALFFISSPNLAQELKQELEQQACHLKTLPDLAECFSLERLENPNDPQGKTFTLHAARIPALTATNKAPLIFLAGGPGQSAIDVGGGVANVFKSLLADRDIVLLEQRGTGQSNGFTCEPKDEDIYADIYQPTDNPKLIKDCLEQFDGDPSQYNTPNAIHDFAAMVSAMGYDKIHIYGGSYGTRAALVYMRLYPEQIESVILDSIAPVQAIVGPFASHGYRAVDLLFSECENNPDCNSRYPALRQQYWALWDAVRQAPIDTTVFHPSTLKPQRFRLDPSKLFQLTIGNLYSQQQRQLLPIVIEQAAAENYAPLAGLMAIAGDQGMSNGLMVNIVCNEDIRRATPEQLDQDTHTPFGDISVKFWQDFCVSWPEYSLDPNHYLPVHSDIPVLALSGQLDPVTPPAWGNMAVENLTNATHLITDNTAHIVGFRGCGPKLVKQFLNAPEQPLEKAECLKELPSVVFMRSINAH